jgi:hypothetical protein
MIKNLSKTYNKIKGRKTKMRREENSKDLPQKRN